MKVAFLTPTFNIGGYEKFLLNLIEGLNEENDYEIYVIVMNGIGEYKKDFEKKAKIIDLKQTRARYCFTSLYKIIKEINFDVFYVSFANYVIMVSVIKKIIKGKFKIIIGEHLITETKNNFYKKILKVAYRQADEIIAVSQFTKKKLNQNIGIEIEKISVIYNPIITMDFLRNYNSEFKHKWINDENIIVTLIARIEKDKGFQYLLQAFAEMKEKKNIKILIVGDGSYKECLKNICKKEKLENSVEFLGFVKNPIKILKKTDYHFILSDYETFGNTVIEALYCGCNVITYKNSGGPVELLEKFQKGEILEDRTIGTLSDKLNNISKNCPVEFEEKEKFTSKHIAKQYLEKFGEIIK